MSGVLIETDDAKKYGIDLAAVDKKTGLETESLWRESTWATDAIGESQVPDSLKPFVSASGRIMYCLSVGFKNPGRGVMSSEYVALERAEQFGVDIWKIQQVTGRRVAALKLLYEDNLLDEIHVLMDMSGYPVRIQRKREAGWKTPPNTTYVGRPTYWGNPWETAAEYRWNVSETVKADARRVLKGKNLACWCGPSQQCHADVLLLEANREQSCG